MIIYILAILLVAGIYAFVFPSFGRFFPKCPFFVMTHLYCPGCGSQRCIAALLHGHLLAALHQNLLCVLALPVIFYRLYLILVDRSTANTIFMRKSTPWIVLSLVLVFSILRNIPLSPFDILAPY